MLVKRLTYSLLLPLLFAVNGSAQDTLLLRDYRFVKQQDAWLTSPNAAALTRFASRNIAEAEVSISSLRGGLTDYYDSPKALLLNAGIESFYRISPRTVVYGKMDYDNFSGYDMGGSAFVNPSRRPFDITESNLDNEGKKHRDTYSLNGSIGVDVWHGVALGISADYTAANYAKYKDLRHKNKLMDLQLSAGVYAPVMPWLKVGAEYLYHRNTESLIFKTYGNTESKVYKSFINYGAYVGRLEQFGNTGYTEASREMPLVEDHNGVGVQLELDLSDALSFFNSFTYSHGTGYYGNKSPYTVTYTGHSSDAFAYHGRLSLRRSYALHRLDVDISSESLENRVETYLSLINDEGASYYEYYEPVKAADKLWKECSVAYTADLGIVHELPTWTLSATYDRSERRQTAYLYPYYRRQDLTTHAFTLGAVRNIITRRGVWSLSLSAAFQKGNGEPYEDGTFIPPSDKQEHPATMDAYLYREYTWLTAAQYTIGGSVKYSFTLPTAPVAIFLKASAAHRKANELTGYEVGRDRTTLSFSAGCTF